MTAPAIDTDTAALVAHLDAWTARLEEAERQIADLAEWLEAVAEDLIDRTSTA